MARIAQPGEPRARNELDIRHQLVEPRFDRLRAHEHGFFGAARPKDTVGKDMAAIRIGRQLHLINPDESRLALHRHAFHGAEEIPCVWGDDFLFARNQRDLAGSLGGNRPVVVLPRQQTKRETHSATAVAEHPLKCQVGLAGVRRSQDRNHPLAVGRKLHGVRVSKIRRRRKSGIRKFSLPRANFGSSWSLRIVFRRA